MPFDDLSELLEIDYSERIKVFFNDRNLVKFNFARHPEENKDVLSFLTFIGGNSKEELKAIASFLDCQSYQIRIAKRLNFSFELKVRGLKFKTLKTLTQKLNNFQENRQEDGTIKKVKAISLHQPWASFIAMGLKRFETRNWTTNYRGTLVICSAKKNTKQQRSNYTELAKCLNISLSKYPWANFPLGKAIAICELTDCIKMTEEIIYQQPENELVCGHWEVGRFAWQLENVKALDSPFSVKGQQGLWDIEL